MEKMFISKGSTLNNSFRACGAVRFSFLDRFKEYSLKSQHNHTQWTCGQSPCCYLVVPHADIGPNVIIHYRLLFIFRLQRHKIRCSVMEMWRTVCVICYIKISAPSCAAVQLLSQHTHKCTRTHTHTHTHRGQQLCLHSTIAAGSHHVLWHIHGETSTQQLH